MSSYKSDVSEKVRFALTAALIPACNSDHRSGLVMLSRRFGKDHGEIHDRHLQLGTHWDAKGLPICRTSLQTPFRIPTRRGRAVLANRLFIGQRAAAGR